MKKLTIHAFLLSLALAVSLAAQVSPASKTKTTEQKMLPFAMTMALTVVGEMDDEQHLSVLTTFQKQMPSWSDALKPVVDMQSDIEDYKRRNITIKANEEITSKSNKSDRWQMMVGDKFGSIYAILKKNSEEVKATDESDLRFNIGLVSILAAKAPDDIPVDVVKGFRKFGALKHEPDLTSDKTIKKITKTVIGILNTISR